MIDNTGTGVAPAREAETIFDNPLYGWCDRAIKDAGNVSLRIDGEQLRVAGITPNGFAKVEQPGGEYTSVRLDDSLVGELMPQLAHFKDRV